MRQGANGKSNTAVSLSLSKKWGCIIYYKKRADDIRPYGKQGGHTGPPFRFNPHTKKALHKEMPLFYTVFCFLISEVFRKGK